MTDKIKPLKNYWVVVSQFGRVEYYTLRTHKYLSIAYFMEGAKTTTWKDCQKEGWQCVRVNINFEIASK